MGERQLNEGLQYNVIIFWQNKWLKLSERQINIFEKIKTPPVFSKSNSIQLFGGGVYWKNRQMFSCNDSESEIYVYVHEIYV